MRERRNRGPGSIRFVLRATETHQKDGLTLSLPAHGVFVDGAGKTVEAIVDTKDPFRRHTAGKHFSVEDGHRVLRGWLGRRLSSQQRQRLWWDVRQSELPRHAKSELQRMRTEFKLQSRSTPSATAAVG